MIVADRKKIPEIRDMIKDHRRVLLVGCGTCVTVCLAGGEREVGILGSALRMALRLGNHGDVVVDECTIERQCEDAFIDLLAPRGSDYDAICSLGCGAGVQALAERFPKMPVYPGLNTQFMGILESQGVWTEKCSGCGNCRLGRVRRDLPDHALRQAPVQRPVRRIAGREMRGASRPGLRLAIDLRPRGQPGDPRSFRADRASPRLVDRPRRRPPQSSPGRSVHRRPVPAQVTARAFWDAPPPQDGVADEERTPATRTLASSWIRRKWSAPRKLSAYNL